MEKSETDSWKASYNFQLYYLPNYVGLDKKPDRIAFVMEEGKLM